MAPTQFAAKDVLTTLMTTESLLFAVFALTLSFGASSLGRTMLAAPARWMAAVAAVVLTVLGSGAAIAWGNIFLGHWPSGFVHWFPIAALAAGILAQPAFAWLIVFKLFR